jgi:hypothetical protein
VVAIPVTAACVLLACLSPPFRSCEEVRGNDCFYLFPASLGASRSGLNIDAAKTDREQHSISGQLLNEHNYLRYRIGDAVVRRLVPGPDGEKRYYVKHICKNG